MLVFDPYSNPDLDSEDGRPCLMALCLVAVAAAPRDARAVRGAVAVRGGAAVAVAAGRDGAAGTSAAVTGRAATGAAEIASGAAGNGGRVKEETGPSPEIRLSHKRMARLSLKSQ